MRRWAERFFFGLLLLLPGLLKAFDMRHFQPMLSRYGLIPAAALPLFAHALAGLEIGLGLLVLLGSRHPALWLAYEGLFYVFSGAIASILWRGLSVQCGCFGVFSVPLSRRHLLFCLGVAVYLTWRRRRRADKPAHPPAMRAKEA